MMPSHRLLPALSLLLVSLGLGSSLPAQTTEPIPVFNWTTLAGRATLGHDDGPAAQARFNGPSGLARDAAGNLYVADQLNHTIRKINPERVVSTLAGTAGQKGSADGTGTAARFNAPQGLAIDGSGNLYVADAQTVVRKVTPAGVVTTLAGQPGKTGHTDGPAASALFTLIKAIGADSSGNVYVLDDDRVRKISGGNVTTYNSGNNLILDNDRIYTVTLRDSLTVTPSGTVYCVGQASPWSGPGLCIVKLGAADMASFHLSPSTFGAPGSTNPVDVIAGLSPDAGEGFYFSISQRVYYGHESVLAHWDSTGLNWIRALSNRHNLDVSALSISYADAGTTVLYTISEDNSVRILGSFNAYAGSPLPHAPVDGPGAAARFCNLGSLAVDTAGNVWAGDDSFRRITDDGWGGAYLRKIAPDGTTTTVFSSGESDPPTFARSVAADGSGNVYSSVQDYRQIFRRFAPNGTSSILPALTPSNILLSSNAAASPAGVLAVTAPVDAVYKWDPATTQWSILAGAHSDSGSARTERKDGTGSAAVFAALDAIAADRQGNFYVLDSISPATDRTGSSVIRKITAAGVVTTVSRDLVIRNTRDGNQVPVWPRALVVDSTGQFFLLYQDHTVRWLTAAGDPAIVGGSPWTETHEDGRGTTARFGWATALAIDAQDNLYVSDGDADMNGNGAAVRKGQYVGTGPVITTQPLGGAFAAGSAVTLSVTATGTPAPTFQWYRDSVALAGATQATLNLSNLSTANTGSYTVVVTNAAGSVPSNTAAVSLRTTTPPPSGGGGGGGGGGGAPSLWFLGLLAAASALRARQRRAA